MTDRYFIPKTRRQESVNIRLFLDYLCWFTGALAGFGFDSDEDRSGPDLGFSQLRT